MTGNQTDKRHMAVELYARLYSQPYHSPLNEAILMFNDRAEHNPSYGDSVSNQTGATQRIIDEVFPGPQKTSREESKPPVPEATEKSDFGYDVKSFFSEIDRSGDGQVTISELDFEIRQRDRRLPIIEFYQMLLFDSIDELELKRVHKNFEQIAGADGQLSKEDLQAFRDEEASLPAHFREADIDGNLTLDFWDVSISRNWETHDFQFYNSMVQVEQNFHAIAGEDNEISNLEWTEFFANH